MKYIIGVVAMVCLCGAFFMSAGCGESKAKTIFGQKTFVVGKDIALTEIKDFYYTIDASTNPPEFQRYRFTQKEGKYYFYHEKREGNTWPLQEKHITVSGTEEMTATQWGEFCNYIKDGKVTPRKEDANAGYRGPWLYLYWSKDQGIYQVFAFATPEQKKGLEKLCLQLKTKQ